MKLDKAIKMIMLWPQYINKELTRKEGRKISIDDCVKEPTIKEMESVVKRHGLKYSTQDNKTFPGKWYERSGRILVESDMTKLELLRVISTKIKESRN